MSQKMIQLTIDGKQTSVPEGTTILEAARETETEIPVLCFHDATTANGLCRLCVVEVNKGRLLQASCVTPCQADSTVETRNERVERSRRTILEMLDATVDLSEAPEIQGLLQDYHADTDRFPDAKPRDHALIDDNPFYVRDYGQCVLCWRCVQVCAEDAQYTFALTLGNRGYETEVTTSFEIPMTESPCVFCGQCVGICPTGALKPKVEWGLGQGMTEAEIRAMSHRKRSKKQDA